MSEEHGTIGPSGSRRAVPGIPRGIEVLVAKAAVDPAFRELLLQQRAATAATIGLTLDPAEVTMLAAVPAAHLDAIIARTEVPHAHRRTFLGHAAAAMLAALATIAGQPADATEPASRGVRPDVPPGGTGTLGIKPDRPPVPATPPAAPPKPDANVENRVIELAAKQFHVPKEKLARTTDFGKDLKAGANHLLTFRATLDKEFQVTVPPDDFKKARTLGDAIGCVEQALAKRSPSPPPSKSASQPGQQRPDKLPARGGIRPEQPPPGSFGGVRP